MIDHEAEIIGRILINPDSFWEVADILSSNDFINPFLTRVYEGIQAHMESDLPIDAISISDKVKASHEQMIYLVQLQRNTLTSDGVQAYAQRIKEDSQRDRLRKIISDISGSMADEKPETTVGRIMSSLEGMEARSNSEHDYNSMMIQGVNSIEQSMTRKKNGGLVGAPTGLPHLDKALGGLWGPKLIIIAARPAIGKTALMLQMAIAASRQGHPIGIMSLEMDAAELAIRIMSHRTAVNMSAVSFGHDFEVDQMLGKQKNLRPLPLWLEDTLYDLEQITARATQWRLKHKIEAIFIDYLGLITARGRNRLEQMTEITRSFKLLSKRLGIPIIALAQLNRDSEQADREPRLSDMRDSGTVEQDANIVLALHKDDSDEGMLPIINIGILKNRGGKTGWIRNRYAFDGAIQRFKYIEQ